MWLFERIPGNLDRSYTKAGKERPAPNLAAVSTPKQINATHSSEITIRAKLAQEVLVRWPVLEPFRDQATIPTDRIKLMFALEGRNNVRQWNTIATVPSKGRVEKDKLEN